MAARADLYRGFLRRRATPGRVQKPTPTDVAMMRRALELARAAAERGEVPVGAVVYDTATGEAIAQAANTRQHARDPAGHAELIAIRAAASVLGDWRLNGCTLVVTLEPCVMCSGAIVNARLGRVVYGAADPKAGGTRSLYRLLEDSRLNHRVTPIPGVLASESRDLLKAFFRSRRARPSQR
jgi:tRNA(adenine34) deaminase